MGRNVSATPASFAGPLPVGTVPDPVTNYTCTRSATYPEVGEIRQGTGAEAWIIAALADPRFTCRIGGW